MSLVTADITLNKVSNMFFVRDADWDVFLFFYFTYNGGGFDDVHHLLQSLQVRMLMSKLSLLVVQMASSLYTIKPLFSYSKPPSLEPTGNQTLYLYNEAFWIDHPNPLGSLFSAHSLFGHGHHE